MRLFEENWQRKQTRDIEKMKCMLYGWQKETLWSVLTGSMYPVMMTYRDAYIKKTSWDNAYRDKKGEMLSSLLPLLFVSQREDIWEGYS